MYRYDRAIVKSRGEVEVRFVYGAPVTMTLQTGDNQKYNADRRRKEVVNAKSREVVKGR